MLQIKNQKELPRVNSKSDNWTDEFVINRVLIVYHAMHLFV